MEIKVVQEKTQKHIEVFCCYARKDQALLQELKNHLMPLKREGLITLWADTDINAGAEWEKEIHLHLNTSHIILLLVSPDFMASEYCYSTEMMQAMKRHQNREAQVIPIILRPVDWQDAPFAKLQALPQDAHPIISSRWSYPDEGFADVAKGIRKAVEALFSREGQPRLAQQTHAARESKQASLEEKRLRKPEETAQVRKVREDRAAHQRRNKRENKINRHTFITTVASGPSIVWFHTFGLLVGLGLLADLLVHPTPYFPWTVGPISLPWATGIVVLATPLIYLLGYRKAMSLLTMSLIGLMSAVAAYGLTVYISALDFDHQMASHLWFNLTRIMWLGRQVNFGLIIGGIVGVYYGIIILDSYKDVEDTSLAIGVAAIFCLVGWLILAILSLIFQWGFGFGYGWGISLISTVVSCIAIAGLFFSFSVWIRASSTDKQTLSTGSWQADVPLPVESQKSSASLLHILTSRPETIDILLTLEGYREAVQSVALSADGLILASGSRNKSIAIWNTQTGQLLRTLSDHVYKVSSMSLSANGLLLACSSSSGYFDHSIRLWNPQTNQLLRTFSRDRNSHVALALSANGLLLACSGYSDHSIELWNVQTGQLSDILKTFLKNRRYSVESVALSANGSILASGGWDGTKLWNTQTGQLLHTLKGHYGHVTSVALSADGLILASGSEDHTIKLWNTQTGWLLRTLTGHTKAVLSVALSADGLILASASDDETIKIWGVKE